MKCGRLAMIVFGLLLAANVTAQEYICGDIDNDGDGPDIYDLVWMVDWMVTGGPPPDTMIAANVGGCAGVDIHDLWRLTYYLMRDSSAELSCEDIAECEPPTGGVITLDHVDGELYPGVFMSGWYAQSLV